MLPNVVSHEVFNQAKWRKKVLLMLRKKSFRKRFFLSGFFLDQIMVDSPIRKMKLDELVDHPRVCLENFTSRNGNISSEEILVISSLIADRMPSRILEIGTFDGNTTLQMALNAPDNAKIYTLDLPRDEVATKEPVLESDLLFIQDREKHCRKFENTRVAHKIKECFGDSTSYDFSELTKEGLLDLIFIDGGHSYQCVKSDTDNALKILSDNGVILWHDFTPFFGGVYQFLCELSKEIPLIHIEGTNLVLYMRRG